MHKLLQRQLKKTGAIVDKKFLELVDQAYKDADEDRKLLERSLDISSKEMRALYEKLQKSTKEQLKKSEDKLQRVLHELRNQYFLYNYDKNFILTYVSDSAEDILGYKPEEVIGTPFIDYYTDDVVNQNMKESANSIIRGEQIKSKVISVFHKNGQKRYLEISSYPLVDENGEVYEVEGLAKDVTQQHLLQKKLDYLSNHDTLTGVANRHSLYTQLEYILKNAKRNKQSFCIFYIDLDNFKSVNDMLGHNEGDLLLKEFAQLLKRHTRNNDIVARIGGDEFIIVYTNTNNSTKEKLAKKLFSSIEREIMPKYKDFHLSASIGIATYPNDAQTVQELLKKADIAMYRSKNSGKNRFSNY